MAGGERLGWPAVLDITMRADTAYLLSHALVHAAQLPVRTLALAPQPLGSAVTAPPPVSS